MTTAVTTRQEVDTLLKNESSVIAIFYTHWAASSGQLIAIADEFSPQYPRIKFVKVEAEEASEISLEFNVTHAPTTLFFLGGKEFDRWSGSSAQEFTKKLDRFCDESNAIQGDLDPKALLNMRLTMLINSEKVMAFIKGTKTEPQCGFTRTLLEILNKTKVPYNTFDILSSPDVRQGLKEYSNWPTYPQLYVNGKLIGGLDIVKELEEEEELLSALNGE